MVAIPDIMPPEQMQEQSGATMGATSAVPTAPAEAASAGAMGGATSGATSAVPTAPAERGFC